jgi:hypothetical protein
MSTASRTLSSDRDLRLDFFRGLALFCIFIDHLPNNILASFTLQSLMFSDAAEVFIFISGYTAGMVYGRILERQGFMGAAVRIYHRVWQLYVAHVFLFMIYMATVAYTAGALSNPLYAEEFGAANFLDEPGVALVHALLLKFQPQFMDILPLYIVLLAVLPLTLTSFRFSAVTVLIASFALWLWVQLDSRLALPTYPGPDSVWLFNPLAWQALFFFAAWLGWRSIHGGVPWLGKPSLFWFALWLSILALVIRLNWTLHDIYDPIGTPISARLLWPFSSKSDLGVLRFANVLAVAMVISSLLPPRARFLFKPLAWPFLVCGRNSLYIFCLGILLSVIGHLVLNEFFGGVLMQVLVSAAGVTIMAGAAALLEWLGAAQSASGGRAVGTSTASGGAQG